VGQAAVEIGSPESPQFAYTQTGNKPGARITLEGFGMNFHKGRGLLAIE
jgi:hypothetical protein